MNRLLFLSFSIEQYYTQPGEVCLNCRHDFSKTQYVVASGRMLIRDSCVDDVSERGIPSGAADQVPVLTSFASCTLSHLLHLQ